MVQESLAGALAVRARLAAILGGHQRPAMSASEFQGQPGPDFNPLPGLSGQYFNPTEWNQLLTLGWVEPYLQPVVRPSTPQFSSSQPNSQSS